jgi:hypothetical protein
MARALVEKAARDFKRSILFTCFTIHEYYPYVVVEADRFAEGQPATAG